jgi:hypothetical protein
MCALKDERLSAAPPVVAPQSDGTIALSLRSPIFQRSQLLPLQSLRSVEHGRPMYLRRRAQQNAQCQNLGSPTIRPRSVGLVRCLAR